MLKGDRDAMKIMNYDGRGKLLREEKEWVKRESIRIFVFLLCI